MTECICKNQATIDELKTDVKSMKDELHSGDLKFQALETTLTQHGTVLQEIAKQLQSNGKVMQAIKWSIIGVGVTLVALKFGILELLKGLLT